MFGEFAFGEPAFGDVQVYGIIVAGPDLLYVSVASLWPQVEETVVEGPRVRVAGAWPAAESEGW